MIWIRRLLFLPCLLLMVLSLGYIGGYFVAPAAGWVPGIVLAAIGAVAVWMLLRFLAVVALGLSLTLGLLALLLTLLAVSYFFFELERDRWYNNEEEKPVMVAPELKSQEYLASLGVTPSEYPPLDWLAHGAAQANQGLASQQPAAHRVDKPRAQRNPQEVWLKWLGDTMMLLAAMLLGAGLARRGRR